MDDRAKIAFQHYRDVRFFSSLNGLRVLCVFMVMWHHSPARGSMQDRIPLLDSGYTGVDFFFVLSGFLITTLLLREEAQNGRFSLLAFYWRRILRIVPVYFLLVTTVSGYYILVKGQHEFIALLPYYYLFLSNFLTEGIGLLSITWSLAVEEQYYLVWPALLLFLPAAGRMRGLVLLAMIFAFVLAAESGIGGGRTDPDEPFFMLLPVSSYAGLLIGSLLGWVLHQPVSFDWVYRLIRNRFSPILTFAFLAVTLNFIPGPLWGLGNVVVHSIMALCIAAIVVREDHVLRPLLTFPAIARVGEISYGIYLFHLIGLHLAWGLGKNFEGVLTDDALPWVVSLGMVVITIIIAETSFRSFESFFLRFKHSGPGRAVRLEQAAE